MASMELYTIHMLIQSWEGGKVFSILAAFTVTARL